MISSLAGIGIFEIFSFPPPLKPPNPPSSRKPPAPAPMLLIADVKPLLVPFALAFLIVLASRLVDDEGPAVGAPTSFSGPPLAAASMRRVACSTAVPKLPPDERGRASGRERGCPYG